MEELTNAGIKMAEINKLKEANLATVGAVLAAPTKASLFVVVRRLVDVEMLSLLIEC